MSKAKVYKDKLQEAASLRPKNFVAADKNSMGTVEITDFGGIYCTSALRLSPEETIRLGKWIAENFGDEK